MLNAVVQVTVRSLPMARRRVIGLKDEPLMVREEYSVRVPHFCSRGPVLTTSFRCMAQHLKLLIYDYVEDIVERARRTVRRTSS